MQNNIKNINNYIDLQHELINNKKILLLDFWAGWCNPCKHMNIILNQINQKYENKIQIIKINIEENIKLSTKFNITSIPTLIIFKNNDQKQIIHGLITQEQLSNYIDKYL